MGERSASARKQTIRRSNYRSLTEGDHHPVRWREINRIRCRKQRQHAQRYTRHSLSLSSSRSIKVKPSGRRSFLLSSHRPSSSRTSTRENRSGRTRLRHPALCRNSRVTTPPRISPYGEADLTQFREASPTIHIAGQKRRRTEAEDGGIVDAEVGKHDTRIKRRKVKQPLVSEEITTIIASAPILSDTRHTLRHTRMKSTRAHPARAPRNQISTRRKREDPKAILSRTSPLTDRVRKMRSQLKKRVVDAAKKHILHGKGSHNRGTSNVSEMSSVSSEKGLSPDDNYSGSHDSDNTNPTSDSVIDHHRSSKVDQAEEGGTVECRYRKGARDLYQDFVTRFSTRDTGPEAQPSTSNMLFITHHMDEMWPALLLSPELSRLIHNGIKTNRDRQAFMANFAAEEHALKAAFESSDRTVHARAKLVTDIEAQIRRSQNERETDLQDDLDIHQRALDGALKARDKIQNRHEDLITDMRKVDEAAAVVQDHLMTEMSRIFGVPETHQDLACSTKPVSADGAVVSNEASIRIPVPAPSQHGASKTVEGADSAGPIDSDEFLTNNVLKDLLDEWKDRREIAETRLEQHRDAYEYQLRIHITENHDPGTKGEPEDEFGPIFILEGQRLTKEIVRADNAIQSLRAQLRGIGLWDDPDQEEDFRDRSDDGYDDEVIMYRIQNVDRDKIARWMTEVEPDPEALEEDKQAYLSVQLEQQQERPGSSESGGKGSSEVVCYETLSGSQRGSSMEDNGKQMDEQEPGEETNAVDTGARYANHVAEVHETGDIIGSPSGNDVLHASALYDTHRDRQDVTNTITKEKEEINGSQSIHPKALTLTMEHRSEPRSPTASAASVSTGMTSLVWDSDMSMTERMKKKRKIGFWDCSSARGIPAVSKRARKWRNMVRKGQL